MFRLELPRRLWCPAAACLVALSALNTQVFAQEHTVPPLLARPVDHFAAPIAHRLPDGRIEAGGAVFADWSEFKSSGFFQKTLSVCGTPEPDPNAPGPRAQSDCSLDQTNPREIYAPSAGKYRIPVVFHVIHNSSNQGKLSEADIRTQIDMLNNDFLALPGSTGEAGTDVQIEFYLATKKPDGSPTSGIEYVTNNAWYNDGGNYWQTLAWDPSRYVNIYTNDIADPSTLGYVPAFPAEGIVGELSDRIVVRWQVIGAFAADPANSLGRTLTHEMGHYLGLFHTFHAGFPCPGSSSPGCFTNGDRICDTPPEDFPTFGCFDFFSCSGPDDVMNYMDYTDDGCMTHFTPQQARRMRCTLESYRPGLFSLASAVEGACCQISLACSLKSGPDCAAAGGVFKGAGTTCTAAACAPVIQGADTCTSAPLATSSFTDFGTTTGLVNNNTGAICGDIFIPESSTGPDAVYAFKSPGGCTVTAVVTPMGIEQADLSLYVMTSCAGSVGACVAGADLGFPGMKETVTFAAAAGTTYYIVVDGFQGSAGAYQLQVTTIGGPSGACCLPSGGCSSGTQGNCEAFGGVYQGNGSSCSGVTCPMADPNGACCDGQGTCAVMTQSACTAAGSTYNGDFTGCVPLPCADPIGVCCAPNDSCSVNPKSVCDSLGGVFGGNGTTCGGQTNCADIVAACCLDTGACVLKTKSDCNTSNGLFKGIGSSCATINCLAPTGACCLPTAPCSLKTQAECELDGGTYKGNATSCSAGQCAGIEPTGACCHSDGTCDTKSETACIEDGGNYRGNSIACASVNCPAPTGACCFNNGGCTLLTQAACGATTGTYGGNGSTCANGCNDQCLDDPEKTEAGICGCGVPDDDSDGDGTADCRDECPSDANKTEPGLCGCGRPEVNGCPPDAPVTNLTGGGFCGFGTAATTPLLLAGWGVMRRRRRPRGDR